MLKFIKLLFLIFICCNSFIVQVRAFKSAEYYSGVKFDICDKEYIAEMKVVLADLTASINQQPRASLRVNIIDAAKRYMLLLKRYQELEYKVKSFEDRVFPDLILSELERPYSLFYTRCRMDVLGYNTAISNLSASDPVALQDITWQMISGHPIDPILKCEDLFKKEMERALQYVKSRLTVDLIDKAKEYMLLFKQYQDAAYNIQLMEKYVFGTDIIARLRLPLLAYTRCQQALKTKTFSVNIDKSK